MLHETGGVSPDERVTVAIKGVGSGGGDLTLVSAASLGRGGFAIDLPLSGPSGVEDRSLAEPKLTIAMTFNNAIASVGGASSAVAASRASVSMATQ